MNATLRGPRWLYVTLGGLIAAAAVVVTGGLINAQTPTPTPADSTPAASSDNDRSYDEILADELGIGVDELREAQSNARDTYFDQLVDSGDLTEAEAADLKASSPGQIVASVLDTSEFDVIRDFVIAQVASVLQMSPDELKQSLNDGQSLEDIADEQGIESEDIRADLQSRIEQLIDLGVQAGFISEEDAASLKENAGEILDIAFDMEADVNDDAAPEPTATAPSP